MARHLARQTEASLLAGAVQAWIANLVPEASALPVFPQPPSSADAFGLTEAPRGALGHWLSIRDSRISHYGIVAPTTWNASPRDESGLAGPLERALEGVAVADVSDPIEAVRIAVCGSLSRPASVTLWMTDPSKQACVNNDKTMCDRQIRSPRPMPTTPATRRW
jgi:Ni,Fe-hydrogenase III large subunit